MTKPKGFYILFLGISTLLTILVNTTGLAQTNNSPYSIFAIGDLTDNVIDRTSGMGSTGIAYRNSRNLVLSNPASLSALDNQFFVGEIGVNAKYVNYAGNPVSTTAYQSSDITFKRASFGTKIFRNLGTAVGIVPYSEENYEYTSYKPIGNSGNYIQSYDQGYGGINKVFWANSYEFLHHHLSLGLTTSYLFGSIKNKNIISGQGTSVYLSKNDNTFYNNFYFDYGLQYYTSVGKHWDISLGATFANQQNLNTDSYVSILAIDSSLLHYDETVGKYNIPTSYGLGLAITRDKKYTFVADYKYQNWGSQHSTTGDFYYQNSQRASVGFEISKKKIAYNTYFETNYFQAGFYYNKSYLIVNGLSIDDMGGSVSIGVNSKRSPLSFLAVLQYGIKGTKANNLVRENYMSASFIFSFREFWYTRGRRFD